jgi:hypothetical protein
MYTADLRLLYRARSTVVMRIAHGTATNFVAVPHQQTILMEAETMPQEIAALDARLERLRERLKAGDPDMTADELQAIIERVEAKCRELASANGRVIARSASHSAAGLAVVKLKFM